VTYLSPISSVLRSAASLIVVIAALVQPTWVLADQYAYRVPNSGRTDYMPPWSHDSFYTNNTWWILAEDARRGSDVFLWKWDGGFPISQGSAGNFSVVPNVELADRSSGRQTIRWDEAQQKLIALEIHHSSSQYHEFLYDAGTDSWTVAVKDETPPIRSFSGHHLVSLVTDSIGTSWFIDYESTTPRAWYRDGSSSRVQAIAIDSTGNGGTGHTAVAAFTYREGGENAIGIVYSYSSGLKFAWRKDNAPKDAAWNVEIATELYRPDDHLGAMAYLPSGESTSAVVFAAKSSAGQTFVARRASSGA